MEQQLGPRGGGIYQWQKDRWVKLDGSGCQVAVDPKGNPWIVNKQGLIFKRELNGWKRLPGWATDIGIGADGSVFITGTDDDGYAGPNIYQWDGAIWNKLQDGAAGVRIAVDNTGNPWVVNRWGVIYRCINGVWKLLPGEASDIGIGADGSVFIIGRDDDGFLGGSVYSWKDTGWIKVGSAATAISVDPKGKPWTVDKTGVIHKHN